MKFYVYEWYRNDNLNVFHVGKGKGERRFDVHSRNQYFKNMIKKYDCSVRIYRYCETEEEAWEIEQERIAELRIIGQAQTNFHVGGCGGDTWSHRTEEQKEAWRKKQGEIMRRKYEDEYERLRRGRKGKVLTEEHKRNLSIAKKGVKLNLTKEQRQALRMARLGTTLSETTKRKISESRKKQLENNKEELERVRKQLKEITRSKEGRERSKKQAIKNWSDETIRERAISSIKKTWTEEKRNLYSERKKEQWKDEEYRKKISKVMEKTREKSKRGVVKFDGTNFEVFDNFDEPVEKYGVNKPNLVNCCRGKLKRTKGYQWFYTYCKLDEKGKYPNTSI